MPYGWPDGNILDYAFGERVQYAWASTGFPEWFIRPGVAPAMAKLANVPGRRTKIGRRFAQKEGPFSWDRQIMFLPGRRKKPNYFVLRDSTTGAERWRAISILT